MKTTLNQVLLAAVLVLSGCTMCTPEQPAPVSDGGGQGQEVQTGDTDGGVIDPDTAPASDITDASDVADVADADGDTTDVELADAASAEVVVGPPVPPTTECGEGVMSTPQPGDECETVGVTRCSDVGSKWVKVAGFAAAQKYCARPNLLECELSADGSKKWAMRKCAVEANACVLKPALVKLTCQDTGGQATCAFLESAEGEFSFTDLLRPCSEQDYLDGATGCSGNGGIMKCSTIQDAAPAPDYPWVQQYIDKYALLKTCCPTCRYWFVYKTCGDMDIGICWGWQNPEQGVMKAPVCLENIPGKPPSCVYDCQDLKYSEEYGKPPWEK